MNLIYSGLAGLLIGLAAGAAAFYLRIAPLAQTLLGLLAAILLSTTLILYFWVRFPHLSGAPGGVFFGVGLENLLYLGALLAVGAAAHITFGYLKPWIPWVAEYRAVLLAAAGGLYCAISVARGLSILALE